MEFWALVLLMNLYPSLIRSILSSDSIKIVLGNNALGAF